MWCRWAAGRGGMGALGIAPHSGHFRASLAASPARVRAVAHPGLFLWLFFDGVGPTSPVAVTTRPRTTTEEWQLPMAT